MGIWDDWKEFEDPLHLYDINGDGEVDDLEFLICSGDNDLEPGKKKRSNSYYDDEDDDDFDDDLDEDFDDDFDDDLDEDFDEDFDDDFDGDYYVPVQRKSIPKTQAPVRQTDLTPPRTEADEIFDVMPDEYKNEIVSKTRRHLKIALFIGCVLTCLSISMISFSFGSNGHFKGDAYEPLFGFGILFLVIGTSLIVAPPILLFAFEPDLAIKNEIRRMKSTYEYEKVQGDIRSKRAKDYAEFLNIVNSKKQVKKKL